MQGGQGTWESTSCWGGQRWPWDRDVLQAGSTCSTHAANEEHALATAKATGSQVPSPTNRKTRWQAAAAVFQEQLS